MAPVGLLKLNTANPFPQTQRPQIPLLPILFSSRYHPAEVEGGEGSVMPGCRPIVAYTLPSHAQSGAKDIPPVEYIWSQS